MPTLNEVNISSIAPEMWQGEITEDKLNAILSGLLIPNHAESVRLAYELRERMQKDNPCPR